MNLEAGKTYILNLAEKEANGRKRIIKKKMRLVKCYRHHAQFEDKHGIRQSFQYCDLEKIMDRKDGGNEV